MSDDKRKHVWVFISAFGVAFAALSWGYEIITQAFWLKGAMALLLGFFLYRAFIKYV